MTEKVNDRRERGWYWVQNYVIDEYGDRIGAYGIAVYSVLARYCDSSRENAFPSYQTIANALKMSKRKVINTIDELVEIGLIKKETRTGPDGNQSNVYSLVEPSDVPQITGPEVSQKTQDSPTPSAPNAQGDGARGALGVVHEVHRGGACGAPRVVHEVHPYKDQLEKDQFKKGGKDNLQSFTQPLPPFSPNGTGGNGITRSEVARRRAVMSLQNYDGIEPRTLVSLTNHVKRIYGYTALIDRPGDDTIETKMKDEAYRLFQLGFTSDEEMITLATSWKQYADGLRDKRPWGNQLYELAVTVASGTAPGSQQPATNYQDTHNGRTRPQNQTNRPQYGVSSSPVGADTKSIEWRQRGLGRQLVPGTPEFEAAQQLLYGEAA